MSDETYNGWKNYPTWAVHLWLSNDEGLYRWALERTDETVRITEANHGAGLYPYWTPEEARRFQVADMLKDWVTDDLAPDLGASFAADLLGYALGEVDWEEIANTWIEQVGEQVSA